MRQLRGRNSLYVRKVRQQKLAAEKEQAVAKKAEAKGNEEKEKEAIRKELTKKGVKFHPQLGLKKLRILLEDADKE